VADRPGELDIIDFASEVIAPGATIAFVEPAEYRDVEILGSLRANLQVTGVVTIRVTGCFAGHLRAAHLFVEDGGGLLATVRIESAGRAS